MSFGFEDGDLLNSEARRAAWIEARGKAEQLAALADLELGDAVAITERRHVTPRPGVRAMAMEAAASTPIEPGESAVSVTLEVQFSIAG